jgi:hypothetical protein
VSPHLLGHGRSLTPRSGLKPLPQDVTKLVSEHLFGPADVDDVLSDDEQGPTRCVFTYELAVVAHLNHRSKKKKKGKKGQKNGGVSKRMVDRLYREIEGLCEQALLNKCEWMHS